MRLRYGQNVFAQSLIDCVAMRGTPTAGANKFTGYFRDAETGLDYADQRYEQPGMGRFLTPDPLGNAKLQDPGSWNQYSYAGGDPINHVDPSGNYWCTVGSGEHQETVWCEDFSVYIYGNQNAYQAMFNCYFFQQGCPPGPTQTATQQAPTQGTGGIEAARSATIAFAGIQFSSACDAFLSSTTGFSVASVQAKAADADIVDGTTISTPWGTTLFPGDPANAAANQAIADRATGIAGTTVAQYFAAAPNVMAAAQYNGNSIYANSSFPGGEAVGVYTIFHEALHLMGFSDQSLESLFGISPTMIQQTGTMSITYKLMEKCGAP